MTPTPTSLLDRLREPFDPGAWARFVSLYTPLICSWGRRAGLQEPDVQDLAQDVFVTLFRVLPTFTYDRDKSFRGWLRTVTLNTWQGRQRRPDALRGAAGVGDAAAADGLSAAWDEEYRQHLVARAMCVMKADFNEATWRACWEVTAAGRPAAAVAAELGMTVGAVYAAKVRVLNRLRVELRGLLDY